MTTLTPAQKFWGGFYAELHQTADRIRAATAGAVSEAGPAVAQVTEQDKPARPGNCRPATGPGQTGE